ncbi:putative B3 domain-containing protein At4g03160 [Corylus avellana]|uniref:putative B3 domain-containing protein At4g03160 n=1 Tax=Corylus avellana TaxID=13451 RepID=UPI00286A4B20|nr:putative B3 domain-containing protein At4g03160 [Corylus avellana]
MEEERAAWILASMKNPNCLRELRKTENLPARAEDLQLIPGLRGVIGQCSQRYEKELTATDTKPEQSRIFIGKEFVKTSLLPLLNKDEHLEDIGIPVTVYDLKGVGYKMKFKLWSSKYYVLTEGWGAFCRDHPVKPKDVVKLWMFRHREKGEICFVIFFEKMKK